jgi:chromatin segregation and condensation protein Rec8/ScpA/Scc1 (kleisin family)
MEIELQMEKLYALLCEKVKGAGIIEFSTLIKGIARIEAVRTFVLLLFLAQNGRVSLWQNEETEEIYIAVGNLNIARDEKPNA